MKTYWGLAGILAVTVIQRGVFAWCTIVLGGDAGTVGVMAQNILAGERPLFLYGFPYSGALAAYVTAGAFAVAGDSPVTLFAVPVLFSVAWAAVSFGLFRDLYGERAGLAAAWLAAVPSWITTHYTAVPDCSYTPLFLLGTAALWLVVRIVNLDLPPRSYAGHVIGLGILAGLGLWTHLLVAAYLGAGALLLLPFLFRRRFAWAAVWPFLVGGAAMAVCLLPYLATPDRSGGDALRGVHLNPDVLALHVRILAERILPTNVTWPVAQLAWVERGWVGLAGAGMVLWALRVFTAADGRDRVNSLVPLLVAVVFLLLYLPHGMALRAEARYTVVLWSALLWGMVAVPMSSVLRPVRVLAGCLVVAWSAYNLAGWGFQCARRAPVTVAARSDRAWLVDRARAAELTHVEIVGEYDFAVQGQPLTFLSGNTIRFVAASNERRAASAQEAETAPRRGFACAAEAADEVTGALAGLGAAHAVEIGTSFALIHSVAYRPRAMRSVPSREMWVGLDRAEYGVGDGLRDRRRSTYVDGSAEQPARILVDLGRVREVAGLAAFPVRLTADLATQPGGYLIEGSTDGGAFRVIGRTEATVGLAHPAGPAVYLGGDYGWWQAEFPPEPVRYLRITPAAAPAPHWQIAEWVVFEAAPGPHPDPEEDVRWLAAALRDNRVAATTADRWLSARLREVCPDCGAAARHNDHLFMAGGRRQPLRQFRPAPDQALVVARAMADDAARVLVATYGPSLPLRRTDGSAYSLFCFDQSRPEPLVWTGLTVLRP